MYILHVSHLVINVYCMIIYCTIYTSHVAQSAIHIHIHYNHIMIIVTMIRYSKGYVRSDTHGTQHSLTADVQTMGSEQ